jgi:putative transposase
MSIWLLYYHIIWPTRDHRSLIQPAWEKELYTYLGAKAQELGCIPSAINGTSTHVHLVLSIPPSVAVSDVIGILKAGSSRRITRAYPEAGFAWQRDSFIYSVSSAGLERLTGYVKAQKVHHAQGTLIDGFEEPHRNPGANTRMP